MGRNDTMKPSERTGESVRLGLLVVLSATMYMMETFLPGFFLVPGFRWGFSNSIVLFCVIGGRYRDGIIVSALKSVLGSFFTGTLFSFPFLLGFGGVISGAVAMILARKTRLFGISGISIIGACVNNTVQLFLASIIVRSQQVMALMPYIILVGTVSAVVNAIIVSGGLRWLRKRKLNWFLYPNPREGKS